MSKQLPKTIKNIIKHQDISQFGKPTNIFTGCRLNQNYFESFKTSYDIVGDFNFRQRFWSERKQKNNQITKTQQPKQQEQTNLNTTYCHQTQIIQNGTLMNRLSKQKQLEITRHQRTFMQFEKNRNKQQKIKNHLKKRLSYFGTRQVNKIMTYQRKQIQQHLNPQLIDIINDNIPQYWKNSLRDNQKRLKRHIKGNTFKRQVAQQMLQTLKGRKKLNQSIPKIKQQFLTPKCSHSNQNYSTPKGFRLKAFSSSKKYNEIIPNINHKTIELIPRIDFEQVHKINYNSAYKWRISQFCS